MRSCRCHLPHPLHRCRRSPPRLSIRPSPRPRHHERRALQHPHPQMQQIAPTMGATSPSSSSSGAEAPQFHCDGCSSRKARGFVHGCCRLAPRGCTHGYAPPHRPQLCAVCAIWKGVGLQASHMRLQASHMRSHTLESAGRRGSWLHERPAVGGPAASTCLAARAPAFPRRPSSLCAQTHIHTRPHMHIMYTCMYTERQSFHENHRHCARPDTHTHMATCAQHVHMYAC